MEKESILSMYFVIVFTNEFFYFFGVDVESVIRRKTYYIQVK